MLKQSIIAATMITILTGCGGPSLSKNQRDEVTNIAEDVADDASSNAASDAVSKLDNSEIEGKIHKLESRINDMESEINRLRDQNLEDANAAAELERRINELRNH